MSSSDGKMRLVGVWGPPGAHVGGWREPSSPGKAVYEFDSLRRVAELCEAAKLDALFIADANYLHTTHLVEKGDHSADSYSRLIRLEAITLISALAAVTSRLGVIATSTTTYQEPFNLARQISTIDQLSGGRAGWNLVTSQIDAEAGNYGAERHMDHDERYRRAEEFFDVCAGLWDGWDEDALVIDKKAAIYSDVTRFHVLNHRGKYFSVKGPLNLPRPPQGRPVIAQAGASGPGKDLAARIADIIFVASSTFEGTKEFGEDVRARAAKLGRREGEIKLLPGLMPIVGRTESEAREHYERLQANITDEQGLIALRRISVGVDLMQYPLDGPLPDLPLSNGAQARQRIVIEQARKMKLTLRETGRWFAGTDGHNQIWGTPQSIADMMEDWFRKGACDGFCVLYPYFPRGVEDFCTLVVPELQRRGLFRREYQGKTLREHLGVPVPKSRYE